MPTRQYIAKVWLKEPMDMLSIARALSLRDLVTNTAGGEICGFSGEGRLQRDIIIHLSWGSWDAAEKIKVYTTSTMLGADAELAEAHIERVLGGR